MNKSKQNNHKELERSPLGRKTAYISAYDPALLYFVPRAAGREQLGIAPSEPPPFAGIDLWNAYEVSWLDPAGLPRVGIAEIAYSAESASIVESKSLKLYLNSFNETSFSSEEEVQKTIASDLQQGLGIEVIVRLAGPPRWDKQAVAVPDLAIKAMLGAATVIDVDAALYGAVSGFYEERQQQGQGQLFVSRLMRSVCPVTGQPDWATVYVEYYGPPAGQPLDPLWLGQYIVAKRNLAMFHEQCVERLFVDIWGEYQPARLAVWARYTRRGGVDINPYRFDRQSAASLKLDSVGRYLEMVPNLKEVRQ